jgi:mono/diheme cytochrome c family protein
MFMKKMRRTLYQTAVSSLSLLLLSIVFLLAPPAAAQQDPLVPPGVTPDASAGMPIYQDRCADCHGPQGAGDGELAANLPVPPRAFSAPDYRLTAVPSQMYDAISNGLLNQGIGMPPFGSGTTNPISPDNRWHLIATIYSLATPADSLVEGEAVFQTACAECHTDGDGLIAFGDGRFWANQSNEMIFAQLTANSIDEHQLELIDAEWLAVIDYSRSRSFELLQDALDPDDMVIPFDPSFMGQIENGLIVGDVTNATTGATITSGEVRLRAFDMDLNEHLSLTAELDENGRFQFELQDVDAAWVYLASFAYDGISYSSEPDQLLPGHPNINMPITVYDPTTDPGGIIIDRIHVVVQFIEDQIFVNELYVVSNMDTAVFIGADGDPMSGTFQISLPPNVHSISFERGFSNFDSFIPAEEIIQTPTGFADTLPIRPGQGSLNLLVGYGMPYQSGMTIAHAVNYEVRQASIAMPQVGVSVRGEDWLPQEPRVMGTSTVLNYVNPQPAITGNLTFVLEGQPQQIASAPGTTGAMPSNTSTWEIWMGIAFLLAAVIAAGVFIYQWQIAPAAATATSTSPQQLLQEIAALDDAYESGEISATAYNRQRQKLKQQLLELWEE